MPKNIKSSKNIKNSNSNSNNSSVSSNISLTLDEILGTNSDNGIKNSVLQNQDNSIKNTEKTNNPESNTSTSTNANTNTNTNANANTNANTNANASANANASTNANTNIDYILNNGIVKFDNKLQSSMFFVDYKSIHIFANILKTKLNISIPKEIIDLHIINQIPKIIKEYTCNLKKRCKRVINTEYICLGRKLDNKQCTRKKHNGTDFCKSHLIKLSNGRFDEPTQAVVHNKRGRKRKVEFDPRQYDNEYITLWEDIIDGQKVLLDGNNNIYTYDLQAPQYIGKKYIDTKLDLSIYNKNKPSEKPSEKISEKSSYNKDNKIISDIVNPIEEISTLIPTPLLSEEVKRSEKLKSINKIKLRKN